MMAVDLGTEGGRHIRFTPGKPRVLFEGPFDTFPFAGNYDVSSDGQRFLMIQPTTAAANQIHILLNEFEELRPRAPGKR